MKMNMDALKALELKLAEYSKENGIIAEHASSNINRYTRCSDCSGSCQIGCQGRCSGGCQGSCMGGRG